MMVRAMVASEKSGSEPETRNKRKSGSDPMVREVVAHSVSQPGWVAEGWGGGSGGEPEQLDGSAEAPAHFEDLPGNQFPGRQDLEQSFRRPALGELFERGEPDLDALPDRQALRQVGNDHLGPEIGRDVAELLVVGKKHQRFRGKALAQDIVADAALSERNDMLDLLSGVAEPAIESEREVLVEQEPHAALTAGG